MPWNTPLGGAVSCLECGDLSPLWVRGRIKRRQVGALQAQSKCLQPLIAKLRTRPIDQFANGRLDVLELVVQAQLFPFEATHLVKRKNIDALDVAELGGEPGNWPDGFDIIGEAGNQNEAQPDTPLALG